MVHYSVRDAAKKIQTDAYYAAVTCSSTDCPLFKGCSQIPSMGRKYGKSPFRFFFVFNSPQPDDVETGVAAVSSFFRDNWLIPFQKELNVFTNYLISYLVRSPLLDSKELPRNPTTTESAYCWDHFWVDLMEYKPKALILFGDYSFQQIYNKAINKDKLPRPEDQTVVKLRKNRYQIELSSDYSVDVIVCYDPMRTSTRDANKLIEDRTYAVNFLCPNKKDIKISQISIDTIDRLETVKDTLDFFDFLTRGLPKNEMFDLAFDTETSNLNRNFNNKFLSWQFSYKPGHAVFIPIDHPQKPVFSDMVDKRKLIDAFQTFLNSTPEKTRIAWIIAHNAKFDLSVLYGLLRILPRGEIPIWDTMLAMHWLDENRTESMSLKMLGKEYFNFSYKTEALEAREDGDLAGLGYDDLVEYGGSDTILTWHLKQKQMILAQGKGQAFESGQQPDDALDKLDRFMRHYYSPASRAIALMECNGLHVSKPQLQYLQGDDSPIWTRILRIETDELQNAPEVLEFKKQYSQIISGGTSNVDYEDDIWGESSNKEDTASLTFSPGKKDQDNAFYLDFLKLDPLAFSKKTGKPKLDKGFLNHYAPREVYLGLSQIKPYLQHYQTPVAHEDDGDPIYPKNPLQLILELRELTKLGSTYLESIYDTIVDKTGDSIDGRIRASFWLAGTDTGRLASSNPNLQNLPAGRSKMAKEIKNLFQAEAPSKRYPEGTALIQLDYKTAEVRWAAIFAKDQNLIRVFNEARDALLAACDPSSNLSDEEFEATQLASDIHRRTASLMYGVPPDKVSKEMRQASKCLVGSTKIYTSKGIIPISDLVVDSCDDKWLQPLDGVQTTSKNGTTDIVAINHKWVESTIKITTKLGNTIQGDHDHQMMVWQDCCVVQKRLEDIEVGDLLIVARNNEIFSESSPPLPTLEDEDVDTLPSQVSCQVCGYISGNLTAHIHTAHALTTQEYQQQFEDSCLVSKRQTARRMATLLGTTHNIIVPKFPQTMSTHLAKILGYLVAEGDGQVYTMSGHATQSQEMLQDYLACFEYCFGLKLSVAEYDYTNTGVIRMPKKVARFLRDIGLAKAYSETQRVPEIIFRSTKAEIIAFLQAYFEGEGSVKSNSIVVMSASHQLLDDIQQLLLSLNIASIKYTETRITPVSKEKRDYYGLRLGIRDARLFRDTIGFISNQKIEKLEKIRDKSAGMDVIVGLEPLLTSLRSEFTAGRRTYHAINGRHVKFGERLSRLGHINYTFEKFKSRPYVLDALSVWSKYVGNDVHASVSWLVNNQALLVPVTEKIEIHERVKLYDIEVKDDSHTFLANGYLSKNCITFGILFGMGIETLASSNNWSVEEAEKKVEMFFSAFPQLRAWLDANPKRAEKQKYVETLMGRRRRLGFLYMNNSFKDKAKASRLSKNAPIQGQSSDAGILGLVSFLQYLLDNNLERKWLIQNVVHDSCLVQVPMQDLEPALKAMQYHFVDGMKKYLEKYFKFTIPLPIECEIEVGLKYGALTKWDGRPSTLGKLIEKLKEDAKKLWSGDGKKGNKPPKECDLLKFKGK